jgi:predicted HAD superfamily Cof-like phosphohydrolase
MIDYLGFVKKFHATFEMPIGFTPQNLDRKSFARRLRLISEELSEYCQAVATDDIIEIADALADLLYVTFGAAIEHGLPMDEIFWRVQESNMTKSGGKKDASGKLVKPATYKPVDLAFLGEHKCL